MGNRPFSLIIFGAGAIHTYSIVKGKRLKFRVSAIGRKTITSFFDIKRAVHRGMTSKGRAAVLALPRKWQGWKFRLVWISRLWLVFYRDEGTLLHGHMCLTKPSKFGALRN